MLIFMLGVVAGSAGSLIIISALLSTKMRESAYHRIIEVRPR